MSTMLDLVVRPQHSRQVDGLARRANAPSQEHNWEGEFRGLHGSAEGCSICIKASIAFSGDLIEGVGRAVNVAPDLPAGAGELSISGTQCDDAVHFQLWFGAVEMARESFVATGTRSSDGNEIYGSWAVGCFSPHTCGCEGGGGEFKLKRVVIG